MKAKPPMCCEQSHRGPRPRGPLAGREYLAFPPNQVESLEGQTVTEGKELGIPTSQSY